LAVLTKKLGFPYLAVVVTAQNCDYCISASHLSLTTLLSQPVTLRSETYIP